MIKDNIVKMYEKQSSCFEGIPPISTLLVPSLLFLLLCGVAYSQGETNTGLVDFFVLDNNTDGYYSTADYCGGVPDFQFRNLTNDTGLYGLRFYDRDDYLNISDDYDINAGISVGVVFYPERESGNNGNWGGGLVTKNHPDFGWGLIYDMFNNKKITFVLGFEDGLSYRLDTPDEYDYLSWYCAYGTYDGEWMKIIVNDSIVADYHRPGVIKKSDAPIIVGSVQAVPSDRSFYGLIRDVSLHNKSLSVEQVTERCQLEGVSIPGQVPPPTVPPTVPPTETPIPTETPAPIAPAPVSSGGGGGSGTRTVILLANDIDYNLSYDFVKYLQGNNIKVKYVSERFEAYRNYKYTIILGGPDALGMEDIVRTKLTTLEQDAIRNDEENYYLKTEGYRKVFIVAGSDRNLTQESSDVNKETIVRGIKYA